MLALYKTPCKVGGGGGAQRENTVTAGVMPPGQVLLSFKRPSSEEGKQSECKLVSKPAPVNKGVFDYLFRAFEARFRIYLTSSLRHQVWR